MDNATIQEFLDEHDYDIRKTHNGRWIDQKCTMDVVCLVSDCIVEYTSGRNRKSFTVNDIWYNGYTVDNVQQIFSKPNPTEKASNEYDKYFGQPIKLLDAAGIIHGEKSGKACHCHLALARFALQVRAAWRPIIIAALLSISFFGITYILGLRYIFPYTCAVLRILLMAVYISGHHKLILNHFYKR